MTRIAIVEDKKVIRESLMAYVHTEPTYQCVCACSRANEALHEIPQQKPDIILMDIQLPDISGIECASRLVRLLPSARIIMVTVYGEPDLIFKALRAGASGYLLKRCSPEELVAAIREVQQGGVPMSREIARKVIAYFKEQQKSPNEPDDVLELSAREREILELLAQGFADKEIADRLGLKNGTIRWHLQNVYDKLHVHSRTEAVLRFQSGKNS